jgi:hypothetical protein
MKVKAGLFTGPGGDWISSLTLTMDASKDRKKSTVARPIPDEPNAIKPVY